MIKRPKTARLPPEEPPQPKIETAARFPLRMSLVIAAVVLGDFLFFGRMIGVSLAIFLTALAAALAIAARPAAGKTTLIATAGLAVTFLPLLESTGLLSVSIAFTGLAVFAVWIGGAGTKIENLTRAAIGMFVAGPFQYLPDLLRARREGQLGFTGGSLQAWILPLGCGLVFAALFGIANPLIGEWLGYFQPGRLLESLDLVRIIFWFVLFMLVWPVILPRVRDKWRIFGPGRSASDFGHGPLVAALFTPAAILRSLILFNVLFGVQTAMDAAYLWGGIALPEGMTYAAYAHRGAYPLIVTALLAALFVLVALPARKKPTPLILSLVLVFIVQNVMLVISSILRLDLYVEIYSLTLLRMAAFVWMGLVAAGLALILARIVTGKSNLWLVGANLTALALTLYACAFFNFSAFVANYNVAQAVEHDAEIDRQYLVALGPAAIPAIHRLNAELPEVVDWTGRQARCMAKEHTAVMQDWRSWTFRGQRLLRYLETRQFDKPQPPGEDSPKAEG